MSNVNPQTDEFDLVIVGAGVAGWTAARRAQQLGLRPVVLEKHTSGPGFGNGRLSGGHFHAVYRTPLLPPDVLFDELTNKAQGYACPELVRVWSDNVPRGLQFLRSEGGNFAPASQEEFQENVLHPMRPAALGNQWMQKGPDNLLSGMWKRYLDAGGVFRPGRRARELVVENGTVTGVVTEVSGGTETYSGRAILLCDGGFQGNAELVARYITAVYKLRGSPADTGDALQMGLRIGAKAVNMEWFYGHVLTLDSLRNDALWPGFGLYGVMRQGICVDGHGNRFEDEGLGDEIMADRICKSATPGGCWVIFDNETWDAQGRMGECPLNPNLVEQGGGTVLTAYSPGELGDQAGISGDALSATIEGYNAFLDYGKELAVPRTQPGRGLVKYPLHAIPAVAGITFAMGGLLVNAAGQVLDEKETIIKGLYAAGGTMGGLQGGPGFGYSGWVV